MQQLTGEVGNKRLTSVQLLEVCTQTKTTSVRDALSGRNLLSTEVLGCICAFRIERLGRTGVMGTVHQCIAMICSALLSFHVGRC